MHEGFRFKKWFFIAVVIKLAVVTSLLCNLGYFNDGIKLFLDGGDTPMYLTTTQNIIQYHSYSLYRDAATGELEPYTGRMPGYELFLVPLVIIFGRDGGMLAMVTIQVFLSAVAIYCSARLAYDIFKKAYFFYFVFFLGAINTYVAIFDISVLTESLGLSFFIFSVYFIKIKRKVLLNYILAGLFFIIAVWLRQYYFPLALLLVISIWLENKNTNRLKAVIYFFVPIFLFQCAWVIRNYNEKGKIIVFVDDLHAGYKYPERFRELMLFVQAWGGDLVHWNPRAEITVFKAADNVNPVEYVEVTDLLNYIYTSVYNADSLRYLQKLYRLADDKTNPDAARTDALVVEKLKKYRQSFIDEKPFQYYIKASLRLLKNFVVHSGVYNISNTPFTEMNPWGKAYKLFYASLYWLVLACGTIGGVWLIKDRKLEWPYFLIIAFAFYLYLFCPIVLRRIEYRYFVCSYWFLQFTACYLVYKAVNYFKIRYGKPESAQ